MNLAVPATLGDADRLLRRPLLPLLAQRCALTGVLSSATWSGGSGDPATSSKICCQIPRPLHRLKRLYTVVYGPYTTVYNRFNRWSGRGIWQQIFELVAGSPEPPDQVALDSTPVKAHRCASSGKRGRRSRRSASPRVAGTARFMRLSTSYAARR